MNEVMETAVEVRRDAAVAVVTQQSYPLADLDESQFAQLLQRMTLHIRRMKMVQRQLMQPLVHFGVPGLKGEELEKAMGEGRVGLYKAGAELLLKLHNYVAEVEIVTLSHGDPTNTESPAIDVLARCKVHAGSADGPVVGVGMGAANSWEVKHRFRNVGRTCPNCGKPTIVLSKWDAKGGPFKGQRPFVCMTKAGGCGMEFAPDDKRLVDEKPGRAPNPDAYDLENTLVKMAAKRAKVDATIAATATSDLFTQDLEDMGGEQKPKAEPEKKPEPAQARGEPVKPPKESKPTVSRVDLLKSIDALRDKRGINDQEMLDLINATLDRKFTKYNQISNDEILEVCARLAPSEEATDDGAQEA